MTEMFHTIKFPDFLAGIMMCDEAVIQCQDCGLHHSIMLRLNLSDTILMPWQCIRCCWKTIEYNELPIRMYFWIMINDTHYGINFQTGEIHALPGPQLFGPGV